MSASSEHQVCAICGCEEATTRDHVPPKGIFPRPRPALITVPACDDCNRGSSKLDETFRAYLGLHASINPEVAKGVFQDSLRSLAHNRALYREVLRNSEDLPFFTPAGVYAGDGLRIHWNSEAHDAVVEKCIRGLYFHHFGSVLGQSAEIRVQWLRGVPPGLEFLSYAPLEIIGDNQVMYRYAKSDSEPLRTIWLFNFYESHIASGYSSPQDDA